MQLIEADDIIGYGHKKNVNVQSLSLLSGDRSFKTSERQHLIIQKDSECEHTHIALCNRH